MSQLSDRQIVTTRIFPHSKAKLFNAFSNSDHLKNWWGPKGFTNTFQKFDFTSGGKWNFIMHSPNGENYSNECIFDQILPNDLLSWTHLGHPYHALFAFEEITPFETRLTFTMTFESVEECQKLRPLIIPSNEENFNRLDHELKQA